MEYNKTSTNRRFILLLFNSDAANYVIAGLMMLIFIFSLVGFSVATTQPEYRFAVWVPVLLGSLSLIILTSSIVRLVKSFLEG